MTKILGIFLFILGLGCFSMMPVGIGQLCIQNGPIGTVLLILGFITIPFQLWMYTLGGLCMEA